MLLYTRSIKLMYLIQLKKIKLFDRLLCIIILIYKGIVMLTTFL